VFSSNHIILKQQKQPIKKRKLVKVQNKIEVTVTNMAAKLLLLLDDHDLAASAANERGGRELVVILQHRTRHPKKKQQLNNKFFKTKAKNVFQRVHTGTRNCIQKKMNTFTSYR